MDAKQKQLEKERDKALGDLLVQECKNKNANPETIITILESGADINYAHSKPLYFASKNHNFDLVKILINNGALTPPIARKYISTMCDYKGFSDKKEPEFFALLDLAHNKTGNYMELFTPYINNMAVNGRLDKIQSLMDRYYLTEYEVVNVIYIRIIFEVIHNEHFEILHFIEKHKKWIDDSSFDLAVSSGELEVLDYMLDTDGIRMPSEPSVALAVYEGYFDILDLLHDNGYVFDANPLYLEKACRAVFTKGTASLEYLLEHGYTLDDKYKGKTIDEHAEIDNNKPLILWLGYSEEKRKELTKQREHEEYLKTLIPNPFIKKNDNSRLAYRRNGDSSADYVSTKSYNSSSSSSTIKKSSLEKNNNYKVNTSNKNVNSSQKNSCGVLDNSKYEYKNADLESLDSITSLRGGDFYKNDSSDNNLKLKNATNRAINIDSIDENIANLKREKQLQIEKQKQLLKALEKEEEQEREEKKRKELEDEYLKRIEHERRVAEELEFELLKRQETSESEILKREREKEQELKRRHESELEKERKRVELLKIELQRKREEEEREAQRQEKERILKLETELVKELEKEKQKALELERQIKDAQLEREKKALDEEKRKAKELEEQYKKEILEEKQKALELEEKLRQKKIEQEKRAEEEKREAQEKKLRLLELEAQYTSELEKEKQKAKELQLALEKKQADFEKQLERERAEKFKLEKEQKEKEEYLKQQQEQEKQKLLQEQEEKREKLRLAGEIQQKKLQANIELAKEKEQILKQKQELEKAKLAEEKRRIQAERDRIERERQRLEQDRLKNLKTEDEFARLASHEQKKAQITERNIKQEIKKERENSLVLNSFAENISSQNNLRQSNLNNVREEDNKKLLPSDIVTSFDEDFDSSLELNFDFLEDDEDFLNSQSSVREQTSSKDNQKNNVGLDFNNQAGDKGVKIVKARKKDEINKASDKDKNSKNLKDFSIDKSNNDLDSNDFADNKDNSFPSKTKPEEKVKISKAQLKVKKDTSADEVLNKISGTNSKADLNKITSDNSIKANEKKDSKNKKESSLKLEKPDKSLKKQEKNSKNKASKNTDMNVAKDNGAVKEISTPDIQVESAIKVNKDLGLEFDLYDVVDLDKNLVEEFLKHKRYSDDIVWFSTEYFDLEKERLVRLIDSNDKEAMYEGAKRAFFEGKESESIKLLELACVQGHTPAYMALASIYEDRGELNKAIKMYFEAYSFGDQSAIIKASEILFYFDKEKALKVLTTTAEDGNMFAIHKLISYYEDEGDEASVRFWEGELF